MDSLYEQFQEMGFDSENLCLEPECSEWRNEAYPINAKAIGYEGNIQYCFIEGYGNMVFAANPDSAVHQKVYPLARNFYDFMRLILACGSTTPVEQIVWMDRKKFQDFVSYELEVESKPDREHLNKLADAFHLSPMEDPFFYVKRIQKNFDDSQIQFSPETAGS